MKFCLSYLWHIQYFLFQRYCFSKTKVLSFDIKNEMPQKYLKFGTAEQKCGFGLFVVFFYEKRTKGLLVLIIIF